MLSLLLRAAPSSSEQLLDSAGAALCTGGRYVSILLDFDYVLVLFYEM